MERSNLEPLTVTSVKLILRLPEDVSGVQYFLDQEQFLENISRELADTQGHSEARMGFDRFEVLVAAVIIPTYVKDSTLPYVDVEVKNVVLDDASSIALFCPHRVRKSVH